MSAGDERRIPPDLPLGELRSLLNTFPASNFSAEDLHTASEIFYQAGAYEEASAIMGEMVSRAPGDASVRVRHGICLKQAGRDHEAADAFRQAVEIAPEVQQIYHELRQLLYASQRYEDAAQVALRELKQFGASDELLFSLATIYLKVGSPREADETISLLTEQDSPAERTLMFAISFFTESRKYPQAVAAARKLASSYPSAEARMALARVLLSAGRYGEAIPVLEPLLHDNEDDAEGWRMLSTAYAESGVLSEALKCALRSAHLRPGNADVWYHAASLAARLGDIPLAEEWFEKAKALDPLNPSIVIAQANMIADAGRNGEAIRILDGFERVAGHNREVQGCRLLLLSRGGDITAPSSSDIVNSLPKAGGHDAVPDRFWRSTLVQGRVIVALMQREVSNRTVHSRIGLLSALIEPISQIIMLGVVLTIFNHGQPPLGTSLFFFYATGVLPFYVFLHIVNATMNVYAEATPLLSIPRIRRIDVVISNACTEFLIGACTAVVIFSLFFTFGYGQGTDNIGQAVAAYAATGLFALGVGLVGSTMNNFTRAWERSWQTVQRVLYFLSGIFFIPQMMPDWVRDILVWNPLLVTIEWFRSGFFQQYSPPWIDTGFVIVISMALITLGLALERAFRRHIRAVA